MPETHNQKGETTYGRFWGVKLFITDKCIGLVESLGEFYPKAGWQRCAVHFYRNAFSFVPNGKVKEVAQMLKAVHARRTGKRP